MRIWGNKPRLLAATDPLEGGVWARDYQPTARREPRLYSGRTSEKRCDVPGQMKYLAGQRDIVAKIGTVPPDVDR